MQELKTCLGEYRLQQREINGRNRVPKTAFDQTGWHIRRIHVEHVRIYLRRTQWCHLHGSSGYCLQWIVFIHPGRWTYVYFMDVMRRNGIRLCACGCFGWTLGLKVRVHGRWLCCNKLADSFLWIWYAVWIIVNPIHPKYFVMIKSPQWLVCHSTVWLWHLLDQYHIMLETYLTQPFGLCPG